MKTFRSVVGPVEFMTATVMYVFLVFLYHAINKGMTFEGALVGFGGMLFVVFAGNEVQEAEPTEKTSSNSSGQN